MSSRWLNPHHGFPDSPVHRLPTGLKLSVALVVIIGTALVPWRMSGWFAGVAVLLGVTVLFSRLPAIFLAKRILVLSPFVSGVALMNALQPAGRADWREIATRSALCLFAVILVSNTTPFSKILRALKAVRVPGLLITTIALMHRYLFVLGDEAERMRRARMSRTFSRGRRFQWRAMSTVVGQLFVRASERAERIYHAMCARGWK
ncbi:MAG TPA: energy-coupling factor transporter transmembrane component T [Verrucomicrobiae bacterium]|nr:energy-coupling factor transporter transmembrane component T [Verrucomicrobiae bacterium]